MISRLNLSEWALANRTLVGYFMLLLGVLGVWGYLHLGQSEDPPFTFRVMVVRTIWPGATADEVDRLVTDRIEEKLQELDSLDYLRSYSRPGESQVFVLYREDLPHDRMADNWYQTRKKVSDIRNLLPKGVVGPFFNDEFGDTFGNIYALQGKDFSYEELKDYADRIRDRLLRVRDVAKVEFIGLQEERIFVDVANTRRAQLGIPPTLIAEVIAQQNDVTPAGDFDTASDKIYLRVTGGLSKIQELEQLPIEYQGRTFRLGDIAEIYRGYQDPPAPRMRFNGENGIGIAVSMEKGGDIIRLGKALDAEFDSLNEVVPLGMELSRVANQPRAVSRGINEFVRALAEAVAIVLVVCFLSLGVRVGMVVMASIPLVLGMTFATMHYFGIGLHKISLGSLVIALGLLVDDAIIAVEMMAVKLEQGYDRVKAAAFAYSSTAFPMLSGTLITAAGFLPIATAKSSTGEYTVSIFQVVTLALLLSWIAAVIFVPLLGYKLLPEKGLSDDGKAHDEHAVYNTRFYQRFRAIVQTCVNRRWTTIGVTVGLFVGSLVLFSQVPQQFFPASTRLELLVDLKLPEGASIAQTEESAHRLETILSKMEGLDSYVAYIGSGAPRFILPLDQQLPAASFAQFVLNTHDYPSRESVRSKLLELLPQHFPEARWRVNRLENGPPVGYVLQYRVSGPDREVARIHAEKIAALMRANPYPEGVHLDTEEPSKVIHVEIDQARARSLGVTTSTVSQLLETSINGGTLTHYREDNKLIQIVLRGPPRERHHLELLGSLSVPTQTGGNVPLSQVARLEYRFEPGILWRRNRIPTINVRADIYEDIQPPEVVAQLAPEIAKIQASMPPGYRLELGGTVEDSGKGQKSVNVGMPLFLLVVFTILMIQLKSFSQSFMVFLTAPLGIIGVASFLLLFGQPFGFVAMLGTIALLGMIMRNSVILIDQIRQDLELGRPPFEAVVEATVRRLRPIALTALAAVLAMIPLSRSVFFGPMAVAIMGGLIAATVLTLLFLPALYAAWFKVPRSMRRDSATSA
ncbi:MAG: efflux transporter [Panacagrimonas sp.]|jgi:multidrug efflux pump|nr:efflux RND transporter permease subunit [Panacagrimonas sp.]MCC2656609.1 efflux transporter [Panacagrimonas sp.]